MKPSELPDVKRRVVAVDTETSGLHPDDGARVSVVSIAWLDEDVSPVAMAWPFDQGTLDKLPQETLDLDGNPNLPQHEWQALLKWLSRQRLVFHNAKFDLHFLNAGTRHWAGQDLCEQTYWDTMLATKELDPKLPVGLKPTAERWKLAGGGERDKELALKEYLRKTKLRSPIPSGAGYDLVPWAVMEPYATEDARLTILLWAHQIERVACGEGRLLLIEHQFEVCKALYKMELRGVPYDVEASLAAAEKLNREAKELAAKLPFRATLDGAKKFFFNDRGVIPYKTTDKGNAQLDDEVLHRMIEDGVMWAEEFAMLGRKQRAVSMWYGGYPRLAGPDGKLRTTYRQTRVTSGRMSVERIQLQAIPKEDKAIEGVPSVRSLIYPEPGWEMWNLDLSQAELRVAAKYCKCNRMLEMLEAGADLHGITTEEIFGIHKGHPDWGFKRDIAKRLTFGGIFQIGGKTFQKTLAKLAHIDWPLSQCEAAVKRWRDLYPEFGRMYHRADAHADRHGWVTLMPGTEWEQRSYFGEREWSNTAWNRIVQGSLAVFNGIWMVRTERSHPGLLVLNVHDSQVLYTRAGEGQAAAEAIAADAAAEATRLFKVQMRTDVNRWEYAVAKEAAA